jgi:hypothetical protein
LPTYAHTPWWWKEVGVGPEVPWTGSAWQWDAAGRLKALATTFSWPSVSDVRGEFSYEGKLPIWRVDQCEDMRVIFKNKIFQTLTFLSCIILFMRPKIWHSGNAACRAENFMSKVGINHTLRKQKTATLPLSTALSRKTVILKCTSLELQ